jgi:hypothetical protein
VFGLVAAEQLQAEFEERADARCAKHVGAIQVEEYLADGEHLAAVVLPALFKLFQKKQRVQRLAA